MFYFLETVKKIFPNSKNESARKSIAKALKHVPRRGKRKHQSITVEKDNNTDVINDGDIHKRCLLYTSPSPRDS